MTKIGDSENRVARKVIIFSYLYHNIAGAPHVLSKLFVQDIHYAYTSCFLEMFALKMQHFH